MRWLLACVAGVVAPLAALHAQAQIQTAADTTGRTREWGSVGIYGGYAYDIIRSAFSVESNGALSEASDCGRFERGTGGSPLIGATLEAPLKGEFRWSILADFHETDGTLRFPCVDPASIRLPDGSVVPALTDHVADISYSQITARFSIDYQPSFLPALRFSAGPALALIFSGRYSAREEVVSPSNAEFVGGGGQVRAYGADNFTDGTTLSFGIAAGISYRAKAGERFTIAPGISGLMKLTDDLPSVHMRTHTIAATLALVYRIDREIDTIVPPLIVKHDTIAQPEPLTISFNAKARGKDGTISDTMVFRENKLITTQLRPLLTYLFFDRGDSTIPERYVRRAPEQIVNFNENALEHLGTLDIYHNLLDIIGARMRRNRAAAITVTGTQPDAPADRGKLSLAEARARGVKNYLVDVWKISPDRIAVATRGEPAAITNPETEEGAAENRRVEISSAVYQITEPVLFADTVNTEELPALTIHPDVVSGGGIERWSAELRSNGRHVASLSGAGTPPLRIDVPVDSTAQLGNSGTTSLDVAMTIHDVTGRSASAGYTVPLAHISNPLGIRYGSGTYSLILFDFNSAQLRAEHLRTVSVVNARTDSTAHANVYGYTDKLGSDETNQILSAQRAKAVGASIKAHVDDVVGRGESQLLYDNSLPEGRFYCRSVTIETAGR